MAGNGDIYIGESGSEVEVSRFGRTFTIGRAKKERSGETADGGLHWDTIARKKTFTLEYSHIDTPALAVFETLYDIDGPLSMLVYKASGYDTYIVKMEPFENTRLTLIGDGIWTGASFLFKEV
ncbi:MAG: hypothetical protein KJN62_02490 [Deltaproteobacteria bacterium]|nr:hypothetical protein [Deltaproteobacteria bacterium]